MLIRNTINRQFPSITYNYRSFDRSEESDTPSVPVSINLYSDTQTLPTTGMYEAMREAKIGDEQSGTDPTTLALEDHVAQLLGKPHSLFLPTGTMANLIATLIHNKRRLALVCHEWAHIYIDEMANVTNIAGSLVIPSPNHDGTFTFHDVVRTLKNAHLPPVGMVAMEQTFNAAAGSVIPLSHVEEMFAYTRTQSFALHIDGARLLNACVVQNTKAANYGALCDSLWIDLTKGLGAPFGAVLAGDTAFIREAKFWKKALGGAMRQSGIMAAAGLYALENHVERLAQDHTLALDLASQITSLPTENIDVIPPQSNMVFLRMNSTSTISTAVLYGILASHGIGAAVYWRKDVPWIRFVTHLDITQEDIQRTITVIAEAVVTKKQSS